VSAFTHNYEAQSCSEHSFGTGVPTRRFCLNAGTSHIRRRFARFQDGRIAEIFLVNHKAVRRVIGTATAPKAPATNDLLLAMIAAGDGSLAALRDRALLLLGFAGAFRRSELVALDCEEHRRNRRGTQDRYSPQQD
jgi:integrase